MRDAGRLEVGLQTQGAPGGEGQLEARILVRSRRAAHLPSVQTGDVARGRQAQTMAWDRGARLGTAVEALEQALGERPGDARAGAGDGEPDRRAVAVHAQARRLPGRRVLARVVEQVLDRQAEEGL